MFSAWRVSVVLNAINNTGGAFGQLIAQSNNAQARITAMNETIARVGPIASAAFLTAGVALAGFTMKGAQAAADFQTAMVTVGIATGSVGKQLDQMQSMVLRISSRTAQDAVTIANETAMFGKAGFNSEQVQKLMPIVANYADVQNLSHGTDPVEAIKTAAQFLHLEKAYTTETAGPALEALNKLSFLQPEELKKVVTQGRYFIPTSRALGLTLQDTVMEAAEMGITGFLAGRGGTSVGGTILGALNSITVTAHTQNAKANAEARLGLLNKDGTSRFFDAGHERLMMSELFDHLEAERNAYGGMDAHGKPMGDLHSFLAVGEKALAQAPKDQVRGFGKFIDDIIAAFGRGATPYIIAKLDPAAREQMKRTEAKYDAIPNIQTAFDRYINTWNGTMQLLGTNFHNILIGIFLPAIKSLQPEVKAFAKWVGDISDKISRNPDLGRKIAIGIAAASVALTAGGLILAGVTLRAVYSLSTLSASISALSLTAGVGSVAGAAGGLGIMGRIGGILKTVLGVGLISSVAGSIKNSTAIRDALWWVFGRPGGKHPGMPKRVMGRTALGGRLPWNLTTKAPGWIEAIMHAPGNAGGWLFGRVGVPGKTIGQTSFGGRGGGNLTASLVDLGEHIKGTFGDIGGVLARVLPVIGRTSLFFVKLGLGIADVIGWVWLAISALQFFMKHAGDIGWVLGSIVGWMRFHLWPGIIAAASTGWQAVSTAFTGAISTLWSNITSFVHQLVTNPMGLLHSMQSGAGGAWDKFVQKFTAGQANQQYTATAPIAGLYGGLRPPSTQPKQSGPNGKQTSETTIKIDVTGSTASNADIAKKVADHIVRRSNFNARVTAATNGSSRMAAAGLNGNAV